MTTVDAIDRFLAVRRTLREFFNGDARIDPVIHNLDCGIAQVMTVRSLNASGQPDGNPVLLAECVDIDGDPDGVRDALDAFMTGQCWHGGGGAMPEFTLQRVRA